MKQHDEGDAFTCIHEQPDHNDPQRDRPEALPQDPVGAATQLRVGNDVPERPDRAQDKARAQRAPFAPECRVRIALPAHLFADGAHEKYHEERQGCGDRDELRFRRCGTGQAERAVLQDGDARHEQQGEEDPSRLAIPAKSQRVAQQLAHSGHAVLPDDKEKRRNHRDEGHQRADRQKGRDRQPAARRSQ